MPHALLSHAFSVIHTFLLLLFSSEWLFQQVRGEFVVLCIQCGRFSKCSWARGGSGQILPHLALTSHHHTLLSSIQLSHSSLCCFSVNVSVNSLPELCIPVPEVTRSHMDHKAKCGYNYVERTTWVTKPVCLKPRLLPDITSQRHRFPASPRNVALDVCLTSPCNAVTHNAARCHP